MNIISALQSLESDIIKYADAAGKDIETIYDEIKTFIESKIAEVETARQNIAAAATTEPKTEA